MRTPKFLKNIRKRMAGQNQELEVSEELTNAYFGNAEAWRIESETGNREHGAQTQEKRFPKR